MLGRRVATPRRADDVVAHASRPRRRSRRQTAGAAAPGSMTIVVKRDSTIAGPAMRRSAGIASKRWTSTSVPACRARCAAGAARRSASPARRRAPAAVADTAAGLGVPADELDRRGRIADREDAWCAGGSRRAARRCRAPAKREPRAALRSPRLVGIAGLGRPVDAGSAPSLAASARKRAGAAPRARARMALTAAGRSARCGRERMRGSGR